MTPPTSSVNQLRGTDYILGSDSLSATQEIPCLLWDPQFTWRSYWSLSWARWIQPTSLHPISPRSTLPPTLRSIPIMLQTTFCIRLYSPTYHLMIHYTEPQQGSILLEKVGQTDVAWVGRWQTQSGRKRDKIPGNWSLPSRRLKTFSMLALPFLSVQSMMWHHFLSFAPVASAEIGGVRMSFVTVLVYMTSSGYKTTQHIKSWCHRGQLWKSQ